MTLATGKFGKSSRISSPTVLLINNLNRFPKSIKAATSESPALPLKTKRTGSSLPPIPKGCISQDGLLAAKTGSTSNICDPKTLGATGSK